MLSCNTESEKEDAAMDERQRLSVTLTKNAAAVLEDLAKRTGKTKAEIVRDALFLEKFAQEAWSGNGHVIVERNGEKREVIPH